MIQLLSVCFLWPEDAVCYWECTWHSYFLSFLVPDHSTISIFLDLALSRNHSSFLTRSGKNNLCCVALRNNPQIPLTWNGKSYGVSPLCVTCGLACLSPLLRLRQLHHYDMGEDICIFARGTFSSGAKWSRTRMSMPDSDLHGSSETWEWSLGDQHLLTLCSYFFSHSSVTFGYSQWSYLNTLDDTRILSGSLTSL